MSKKIVVLASALIFGLFAFVSVDAIASASSDYAVETAAGDCTKCDKADCKGCEGKSESKKECTTEQKKGCCAHGESAESNKGKGEAKKEVPEEKKK